MFSITGYTIIKKIYESHNSLVYQAIRNLDQLPVILKILLDIHTSTERLAWFQREYEVGASQMCKFIFFLSSRLEMNEPRRSEGHEGKKEEQSFSCCCGYFCKIGMLPMK